MGRKSISDQTFIEVNERQDGVCALCGDDLSESAHEIHHLLRVADGGTNDVNNLVLLCDRDEHMYVHGSKFGEAIETEPGFYPFYNGIEAVEDSNEVEELEENTETIDEVEEENEIDEGLGAG